MQPERAHLLEIVRYATDTGPGVPMLMKPKDDDLQALIGDGLLELRPREGSKKFATAFVTEAGRKALDVHFEERDRIKRGKRK